MIRLWTLAHEMEDVASILNGKVFTIRSTQNRAYFFDAKTGCCLLHTTEIKSKVDQEGRLTIVTSSGRVYEMIDVATLIPTTETMSIVSDSVLQESNDTAVLNTDDLIVVSENEDHKHIHYGDGHFLKEFVFNRNITEEEFLAYLNKESYKIIAKGPWYADYTIITGSDNRWTYKLVRRYTD